MNGAVLSCVSTAIASQSKLFLDSSESITVLPASKGKLTIYFFKHLV